ncbi:MAG: PAS domain-containing protein [Geminicoccaceae bacterium]
MLSVLTRKTRPARALRRTVTPTGHERYLGADHVIVSKTDTKGRILYANRHFLDISGFRESELLGAPHSILRHPAMPRAAFRLMWERISTGHEFFAYVINLCREGDHYWVHAHVTPTYDSSGEIIGYHSNRRAPRREAIAAVEPLYARLVDIEQSASDRRTGMEQSTAALVELLESRNMSYDSFIASL